LTVVVEGDRIVDLIAGPRAVDAHEERIDLGGAVVAPGLIDVHVHGVLGVDTLDGAGAVARIAAELPRFGVTAFCPTTVACDPETLERFLIEVGSLRRAVPGEAARVLPAHLESNFINPEFAGAQPHGCLRTPHGAARAPGEFSGDDVLEVIARHRADIGIVTMAPEIPGGFELVQALVAMGVRVSLGHSGASFDEAQQAIAGGARHATHLFNRMRPMTHRDPGLTGAVLASEEVAAELICDGRHVHPAVMRVAIAAKGAGRMMAITDGTAGSGLAPGSRARLGGRTIAVGDVATLDDGTLAGSVLTMDRVVSCLAGPCGLDLVSVVRLCSTTPARELGLVGHGALSKGAAADLTVFSSHLRPQQTWVGGRCVWSEGTMGRPAAS
jgi:N-acetylglucosamine-6-phosphate deacetylase